MTASSMNIISTDLETLTGQHNDEVRTRVKEANEIRRRQVYYFLKWVIPMK